MPYTLFIVNYSLFIIHYSLFIIHYSLFITLIAPKKYFASDSDDA